MKCEVQPDGLSVHVSHPGLTFDMMNYSGKIYFCTTLELLIKMVRAVRLFDILVHCLKYYLLMYDVNVLL